MRYLWIPFSFAVFPTVALAQDGAHRGPSDVVFLVQILLLIFLGRLLGEAMQRLGQPAVTGQLIAGIILGHSVLGALWPDAQQMLFPSKPEQKAMLDAISQFGILMLLLLTGMETDLRLVRRTGLAAVSVSIAGIFVPFVCGFVLGELLPDSLIPKPELRTITSLFLGTALSIASIKIVAMVMREMNFMRRNLGQIIVSSAIIDDSVGWIIISIIFSLSQHGAIDIPSVTRSIFGTVAFLALSFTIGRRIVYFLIRWTNDNFVSEVPVISMILLIMGGMALITHLIGVHTVLGAFVAGVLIGESPILTKHIDDQLRGLIAALFAPVFFGAAGLSADLTILKDLNLFLLTLGLILIASVGKFGGAFLGGKIGGLTKNESLALALGMNARGSTEVIIATIGLSLGALNQDLFTMIVAMAIVTTTIMPPTLRWALARLPMRKEEKERLEREAFAEQGFVTNLERLLLIVDESANGKFASRLVGLIAGSRGMPTTVLKLNELEGAIASKSKEIKHNKETETAIKNAARKPRKLEAKEKKDDKQAGPVDIITKVEDSPAEQAVAREAKKGYDLLFVGVKQTAMDDGAFHSDPARIVVKFEGPLAVVDARSKHLKNPGDSKLKILVPVTGTDISRRGAEFAIALAHASNVSVTALYIRSKPVPHSLRSRLKRPIATHQAEEAILKDIVHMAEQYETTIRTVVRAEVAPEDAILREAKRGNFDLIVMGVSRRPGNALFFGNVAAAMIKHADSSLVFISD